MKVVSLTAVQCCLSELEAAGVDPAVIRDAAEGSGLRAEIDASVAAPTLPDALHPEDTP